MGEYYELLETMNFDEPWRQCNIVNMPATMKDEKEKKEWQARHGNRGEALVGLRARGGDEGDRENGTPPSAELANLSVKQE